MQIQYYIGERELITAVCDLQMQIIYLSVCPSIVCLSICRTLCLSVRPSIHHLSFYLSVKCLSLLFIVLSFYLSIVYHYRLSFYRSLLFILYIICMSVYSSVFLSVIYHSIVYHFIYLSVRPFVPTTYIQYMNIILFNIATMIVVSEMKLNDIFDNHTVPLYSHLMVLPLYFL